MATREEISEVKELDLMELVMDSGIHYRMERDHLKMNCIFHNDNKTPSLAIYSDHYYCYACGVHGDIISWAQQAFEVSFGEAVNILIKHIKEKREDRTT